MTNAFSRYKVGTMKLYADNVESLKKAYPQYANTIEEIPILEEKEKKEINKLISVSNHIKGGVYTLPYNGGFVVYRFLKHGDDIIDGVKYQRHDEHKLTVPILKTICPIDEFYNKFYSKQNLLPPTNLSKREFDKIKPKPFCFDRKGQFKKYVDEDGYIYLIPRNTPWSKKEMELYEHFKDKPNAVFGKIRSATFGYLAESKIDWFESEEQLAKECDEINRKHPASMGGATYEVIHRRFNTTHPKDRKLIIRLPYFNFDNIENIQGAANSWIDSGKGFKWIDNGVSGYNRPEVVDFFADVIKKYLEFKKK